MTRKDRPGQNKLSVRRSLLLAFAQKYTNLALNIPTVMILSRLLTPAQIGVFSVAMAITAVVHMLRDFGISEYVVQHEAPDDDVMRVTFTINLIAAWTVGAILLWLSPYIASFFSEQGLAAVLRVLALSFFVIPFGSVIKSWLSRNMEFGKLYLINSVETVVRTGTVLSLAFLGVGVMSLAWAHLVSMVVSAIACSIWGPAYLVRGFGLSGWRAVSQFGMMRMTGDVAVQLGMRSSDIVIGRMLGMIEAGLYSRGYGLINLFRENVVGAVNAVAFPNFAEHHREHGGSDQAFLTSLTYLTGVSWPFFLFATIMAFPIMRVMFGSQWDASVPLLHWLAIAAMVGTLIYQCNQYLTAIGRVGVATRNEVIFQSARVIIVIVAALQGLVAVAASQILVYALAIVLYYHSLWRAAGLSVPRALRALQPSFWVAISTGMGPGIIYVFVTPGPEQIWVPLLFATPLAAVGWITGCYLFNHPIWHEIKPAYWKVIRTAKGQFST